jgi:hypothetical protein
VITALSHQAKTPALPPPLPVGSMGIAAALSPTPLLCPTACKETRGVVSLPYLDFFQGFLTAKGKGKGQKLVALELSNKRTVSLPPVLDFVSV